MEVTLNSGQQVSQRVAAVRGTAQNPMTTDEVVAKARDLMTPVLGRDKCEALITRLLSLDAEPSVLALRPLLQA